MIISWGPRYKPTMNASAPEFHPQKKLNDDEERPMYSANKSEYPDVIIAAEGV